MKTRGFVLIMVAIAFAFALAKSNGQGNYVVRLISPVTGQVLYAGQKIMIQWKHTLPNIPLPGCESEVWLSLDGGRTFPMWITFLDPRQYIFPLDCSEHAYERCCTWIFVSGATCIIPKATLRSLHRCSPSRRVERQRPKFC